MQPSRAQCINRFEVSGGRLINKVSIGKAVQGEQAGTLNMYGYRVVRIDGRQYAEHRVVWLIELGEWPSELDHINGDRSDNRIENIREVSRSQNLRNQKRRKSNRSGTTGVCWDESRGMWRAYVQGGSGRIFIGRFSTHCDAVNARKLAEKENGYHANHDRA